MFKRLLVFISLVFLLTLSPGVVVAQEALPESVVDTEFAKVAEVVAEPAADYQVVINFFWSETCPHCKKEKPFLENLARSNPQVELHSFEVSSPENAAIFQKVGQGMGLSTSGVPMTLIGKYHLVGYGEDEIHGAAIAETVEACLASQNCPDMVAELVGQEVADEHRIEFEGDREVLPAVRHGSEDSQDSEVKEVSEVSDDGAKDQEVDQTQSLNHLPDIVKVPLVGEVKLANLSLPALTITLGVLDGFNPCAMWVLIFLISLLLGMKNRRRMWILGTTFILASGFVYFLFMSAWLNLFLFLGFVKWIRIGIGLLALGAGIYNLRDYVVNKDASCPVEDSDKKQKTFARLKNITRDKNLFVALGGIILLAFAVNLVELLCSAGFPAIYTQVLSMSDLAGWQYYGYLLLYILMFMIDDLFVFFAAMTTLQMVGIESKYARYSRLIGGILILLIGILMLFKPEWLMFG